MAMFKSKLLVVHSPLAQSGKTTIANLLALELAEKDNLVLVIEINPVTGYSIFLNKRVGEMKRNLKKVLVNPMLLNDNIQKSYHNSNAFFISQNLHDSILDMETYNPENIDKIVTLAKRNFDYIIIDLQSRLLDLATIRVLGANFTHEIDHHITVIDENILSYKVFNDTNELLSQQVTGKRKTTLVINKSHTMYSSFVTPFLKTLPQSDILNVVDVPEVTEFKFVANEGNIYNLGNTKESKAFFDSITLLGEIILEKKAGIGIDLNSRQKKENIKTEKRTGRIKGKSADEKSEDKKKEKLSRKDKKDPNKTLFGKKNKDESAIDMNSESSEEKTKLGTLSRPKKSSEGVTADKKRGLFSKKDNDPALEAKSRLKRDKKNRAAKEVSDEELISEEVIEEQPKKKVSLGFKKKRGG